MSRNKRYFLIILVVLVATVGGYLAGQLTQTGPDRPEGVSRDAVSMLMNTTLPDTDEQEQSVSQWEGNVLVVNFWATWCPPCIDEIPEFVEVSNQYADEPVQFVGLSIDTLENVLDFQDRFDIPYPLLIGATDTLHLASEFGNDARALPFTVILDRDGDVADVTLGTLDAEQLIERIDPLLDANR